MMEKMKGLIRRWLNYCIKIHIFNHFKKRNSELKSRYKSPSLTVLEKKELRKYWKKYIGERIPITFHEIMKGIDKFDVTYIPHEIYESYILPVLNPVEYARALENKGMYTYYFPDIHRPRELVRNIRGVFYGEHGSCTLDEAASVVVNYGKDVVIKPSIESSGGKNVRILNASCEKESILLYFKQYVTDFIVQELVQQSPQTARFNPSSLNTFRVTTLFLNGKCSILFSHFRCGGLGSVVDNGEAGGVLVKVCDDGSFCETGINKKEPRILSHNGIMFSGTRIKHFDRVLNLAISLHHRLPFCAIVGWDIALDFEDNPILIELNLRWPGLYLEQLCGGPAFGGRHQEVMDYVFDRNRQAMRCIER